MSILILHSRDKIYLKWANIHGSPLHMNDHKPKVLNRTLSGLSYQLDDMIFNWLLLGMT